MWQGMPGWTPPTGTTPDPAALTQGWPGRSHGTTSAQYPPPTGWGLPSAAEQSRAETAHQFGDQLHAGEASAQGVYGVATGA